MTWKIRIDHRLTILVCAVFFFITASELASPPSTSAHVKWFAHYDVRTRPVAFAEVASKTFFMIFAAFVVMLFFGFLADGWIAKRWPRSKAAGSSYVEVHEKWVRLGMGAFLLCMWSMGLNILTPELHTQTGWVFTVQFLSAFCLAWRRTCVLSALGICFLYGYGVMQYGMFHMLDYVYFLGIAVFIAGVSLTRLAQVRIPVMTGCLAFSIMWTAIEKFVYPQWTRQVLETHGHMAMGMPSTLFVVVAAFVEFTLAFYLATGRGMLRVGTLILLIIFIAAMPEFGRSDVIGHLPLIAILGVPLMGGNSALQRFWRFPGRGMIVNAAAACLLYTLALSLFFVAYYSVQWLEYSHVPS
jgi:hypothetical protein